MMYIFSQIVRRHGAEAHAEGVCMRVCMHRHASRTKALNRTRYDDVICRCVSARLLHTTTPFRSRAHCSSSTNICIAIIISCTCVHFVCADDARVFRSHQQVTRSTNAVVR